MVNKVWTLDCIHKMLTPRWLLKDTKLSLLSANLSVIFYGRESWSLTLFDLAKFRFFENMVLRTINRGILNKSSEELRQRLIYLHKLHRRLDMVQTLMSSRLTWAEPKNRMGEENTTFRVLIGQRFRKRQLDWPGRLSKWSRFEIRESLDRIVYR